MNLFKTKRLKKIIPFIIIFFTLSILIFFILTSILIGYDVKKNCDIAKSKYEGNCTDALVQILEDENSSFRLKNHAIWSLGQLGDKEALPFLEKKYSGNVPQKESLDNSISQYELKKAINLVNNGLNITQPIWKLIFFFKGY